MPSARASVSASAIDSCELASELLAEDALATLGREPRQVAQRCLTGCAVGIGGIGSSTIFGWSIVVSPQRSHRKCTISRPLTTSAEILVIGRRAQRAPRMLSPVSRTERASPRKRSAMRPPIAAYFGPISFGARFVVMIVTRR